jgi:hypothetical protein
MLQASIAMSLTPRQRAGRLNQLKSKGLTDAGREQLRQTALRNRPSQFSTGPKTAAGKARSAANGKTSQVGALSSRQAKAELRGVNALIRSLSALRREISSSK